MTLCPIKSIDFQALRNLMIRNRIYIEDSLGGKRLVHYSWSNAKYLHSCIERKKERRVFLRADGIH